MFCLFLFTKRVISFSVPDNQKELKNIFSNDGSFLDQFKHMKDKSRLESRIKSFSNSKENSEKNYRYFFKDSLFILIYFD